MILINAQSIKDDLWTNQQLEFCRSCSLANCAMPLNIYVSSVFTNDKHRRGITVWNTIMIDDVIAQISKITEQEYSHGRSDRINISSMTKYACPRFYVKRRKKKLVFHRRNSFEIIYLLCRYFALIHRLLSALIFFPRILWFRLKRFFFLFFFSFIDMSMKISLRFEDRIGIEGR